MKFHFFMFIPWKTNLNSFLFNFAWRKNIQSLQMPMFICLQRLEDFASKKKKFILPFDNLVQEEKKKWKIEKILNRIEKN